MATTHKNRALAAGREHALTHGWREAPLSGVWAGESIGELSTTYGVDLSVPELQDEFEDGFYGEFNCCALAEKREDAWSGEDQLGRDFDDADRSHDG